MFIIIEMSTLIVYNIPYWYILFWIDFAIRLRCRINEVAVVTDSLQVRFILFTRVE